MMSCYILVLTNFSEYDFFLYESFTVQNNIVAVASVGFYLNNFKVVHVILMFVCESQWLLNL